jgi:hypothetical protein
MAIAQGGSAASQLPAVDQYDVNKYIISPLFMGGDYMNYMDIMPNIKGQTKIDHFGKLDKSTLDFNDGVFSSSSTTPFSAVTLSPKRMEMEHEFRAHSLFGRIKGQLMRANTDFDNIDGSVVKKALLEIIGNAAKADFNRQLWLNSTHTANAGSDHLAPGVHYGSYDGIFALCGKTLDAAQQLIATDIANVTSGSALNQATGSTNSALNILDGLYAAATPELRESQMVFFVSGDIADSYAAYLAGTGYAAAGFGALVSGAPMTYKGVPVVVRRDWDKYIVADSSDGDGGSDGSVINGAGHASTSKSNTHRAVLTAQNAFIVGTDFSETQVEQWYSLDAKAYRFRVSYMVGAALADKSLAVVYTPAALRTS